MGIKISELEEISSKKRADVLPIVDMSNTDNPVTNNIKLVDLLNFQSTGSITISSGTTITNGYEVTLPVYYQVGNNSLELRLNSEVLILATDDNDGHYTEVGDEGELSNTIAFYRTDDDGTWTLTEDVSLTAIVKGVSQDE